MKQEKITHARDLHQSTLLIDAHSDMLCDVHPKRKQGRNGKIDCHQAALIAGKYPCPAIERGRQEQTRNGGLIQYAKLLRE